MRRHSIATESPSCMCLCAMLLFFCSSLLDDGLGQGRDRIELEHAWEVDPALTVDWLSPIYSRRLELDLQHLDSPVNSIRFAAARTAWELATNHQSGPPNLLEKLLSSLERGEGNLRTRQMLVAAAAALLDSENVPRILRFADHDLESGQCIEDALIRLGSTLWLEKWRTVVSSKEFHPSDVARALNGIGACEQGQDAELLRVFLRSGEVDPPLRVNAARALGKVANSGQLDLAREILLSNNDNRHFLAALMLIKHEEPGAIPLLSTILSDGAGPARQLAFDRLTVLDRAAMLETSKSLIADADSGLRQKVVTFLQSMEDRASFLLFARRLADPIVSIRRQVRKELLRRSGEPEYRALVDKIISQAITAPQFEAMEQAIVLIVELSDSTRDADLLKLLEHPVPDLNIRAAWALSVLATEPATLRAMLQHVKNWADNVTSARLVSQRNDEHRMSYLLEAFGTRRFQEADALLRIFIPKAQGVKRLPMRTRLPGIWAIGKLHEDRPDDGLRKELEARVNDMAPIDGELQEVRYVSALALGFLGDTQAIETLSKYPGSPKNSLHEACAWSIDRIQNGTRLPETAP